MGFRVEKNGQETWIVDDNGTHVATMNTSLGPDAAKAYAEVLSATPELLAAADEVVKAAASVADEIRNLGGDDDGIPDDTT